MAAPPFVTSITYITQILVLINRAKIVKLKTDGNLYEIGVLLHLYTLNISTLVFELMNQCFEILLSMLLFSIYLFLNPWLIELFYPFSSTKCSFFQGGAKWHLQIWGKRNPVNIFGGFPYIAFWPRKLPLHYFYEKNRKKVMFFFYF